MELISKIKDSVLYGKLDECRNLVNAALQDALPLEEILYDGLVAGMSEVGRRFKTGDYFVPEVLIAARAMNAGMAILEPLLSRSGIAPRGRLVLGTVKDDIHDIGKNLVGMMMKGAGYEIIDLGHDVHPAKFVEALAGGDVDALLMSSLLTTTMPNMGRTMQALRESGCRDDVVVMIGGAPLSQRYADEIGADGFAPDAATAVEILNVLLKRRGRF